jgi:hypothetical protein
MLEWLKPKTQYPMYWSDLSRRQKVCVAIFIAAMIVIGGEIDHADIGPKPRRKSFEPYPHSVSQVHSDLKPENYCPPNCK